MSAPGAGHVSCEGFGLTSVPSPLHIVSSPSCGRLSRPLSTMDRSDFPGAIGIPVLRSVMPTSIFLGNPWDLPSSWTVLSWHAILCDPGGIYAGSPLYRPFHTGFRDVNHVAFRIFMPLTRLNRLGNCGIPYGLPGSLSTLRPACCQVRTQDSLPVERLPPYRTETFTLSEPPSFAWRTNDLDCRRARNLVTLRLVEDIWC